MTEIAKIPSTVSESLTDENLLSFAQKSLWERDFLRDSYSVLRAESGNWANHLSAAFRLKGLLNVTALQQAVAEIGRRHPSLRTHFSIVNDQPIQVISEESAVQVSVEDLGQMSPNQRQKAALQLATEWTKQPFDLALAPLWRVKLLRLTTEENILVAIAHQIVCDSRSFHVFFRELAALYTAFNAGERSPLSHPLIQSPNLAIWEREWLSDRELLESELSYWKQQLGDSLPVLELPLDRPRSPVAIYRGSRLSLLLCDRLSSALWALSQQFDVTPFETLLAAFVTLLYRYTGSEDIIVGTPASQRFAIETDGKIGLFSNTLLLRTDLSGNPNFLQLLERVRQVVLAARAHQNLPFEKLISELHLEAKTLENQRFQVWFEAIDAAESEWQISGLNVERLSPIEIPAKYDLSSIVRQHKRDLELEITYNAEIFSSQQIGEMLAQIEQLLEQIIKNSERKIGDFSLVTPQAELILPNPSVPIIPKWEGTLHDRFSQQARKVSENLAVVDAEVSWSYADLDELSNQLANYLRDRGIQNQDIVAIYSHRSASLVWALLGILKAGAAFVILDPAYPASRLIDCLTIAQPRAWLQLEAAGELPATLNEFIANFSDDCRLKLPRSIAAARNLLARHSTANPLIEIKPDDCAYIAFTSGSTGKPKGIVGTHRPLSHFIKWHCETFGFNESDRFSMLSGLAHDPLLRDIFTPLWLGATVVMPDPNYLRSPGQLVKWMQQEKITVSHLTPAMGQLLAETPPEMAANREIESLRYLFFGGDVLTKQDVIKIFQIAPNATCINFYGATETPQAMGYFIIANFNNIGESEAKFFKERLPLGRGIDGVQLLVLNGGQQLAGTGELGEIHIRTPYLAKGYLGDDERTQDRFFVNPFAQTPDDRFYKTGDLGRYNPDGNIEIIGRADNQVKIRGFRIELGEIEAMLSQHPDIINRVVIVREDSPGEKRLVAYIVPNRDRTPTPRELRQFLKEKLPEYMVPSAFVMLDALPITPNGKIDRRALKAPDRIEGESEANFVAPGDELALQLTKIWASVLGVASVGVTDNFYELGGHSLLAVRLIAQIEKAIGKTLPVAAIFQAQTVMELAKIIRSEGWKSPCPSLIVIQPGESKPPLFCIHVLGKGLSYYRPLARHIGSDLPLYGLAVQVMDSSQNAPPNRVEDLASYYIKEMQVLQPQGPYFLAGFSFGGVVAFEMARQLQLAGEKVALLALLDAIAPNAIERLPQRQVISNHWNNFLQIGPGYIVAKVLEKLVRLKDKLLWMYCKFCMKKGRPLPDNMGDLAFLEVNRLAESSYVPQVYPERVTLLRALDRTAQVAEVAYKIDPLLGWESLAVGGLEIYDIPGDHFSMLEEPDVKMLAKQLRDCIDKAAING